MRERIGEYFIRLELLSFEQAEAVIVYQQQHPKLCFGEIALLLDFISDEDLKGYEESQ